MTSSLTAPWVARARRPLGLVRAVTRWPVDSQLNARRNALVASTQLTARSHERQQVEDFLDLHTRRWQARRVPRIGPAELPGPAADVAPLRAAL
ncbi:hypothetical protein G7072_12505 [Nocardioides sp. HDW12B]|uniref:hypothetical protein n=1 Tax=Nocardioides sp. HDW12B TaxID=2714939 RepID=UPI00140D9B95|nr:hypothetical protein [Nocardioides sp. HDW12B]QIK67054.1 hypothetical protein G7072_12505 [Nocardioides sp. HDW12B]